MKNRKDWNKQCTELLKTLFPEKRKEILILIIILPVLWLFSLFAADHKEIHTLLRPGFQESERKVVLTYEYQGKKAFDNSMTVALKKYEQEPAIIRQKLERTAEDFRKMFFTAERFKRISGPPNFPKRWQEAEIEYHISPDNMQLPEGDWNYFELFRKQAERELEVEVSLRNREEEVSFTERVRIRAEDFDETYRQSLIHKQIAKEIALLQEEESSKLTLPTEFAGNNIKWKAMQSKITFKEMLAFMLIFLVIMSALSKAAAKEKIRQKHRRYLRDFGQMLHHLVLLLKCGKNPYSAIVTACQNKGKFDMDFKEALQECYQKIAHQETMKTAIAVFYEKCPLPEIKRFEQIFLMAYERGDEWSIHYLEQFRDDLFAKRLREINEYMQKATSRLVFPMVLFLIVIIILTIVPAFEGV